MKRKIVKLQKEFPAFRIWLNYCFVNGKEEYNIGFEEKASGWNDDVYSKNLDKCIRKAKNKICN